MRRFLPLVGLLIASLDPDSALAIGSCEGMNTRYKLISVAESAGLLAYEVEKDWCNTEESGPGDGDEAVLTALLVTDLKSRPKLWFFTPASAGEKKNAPGRPLKPQAEWAAYAKAQGFRPISEVALGASGGACTAQALALKGDKPVPLSEAQGKHNFIRRVLTLRLRAAGQELPLSKLGQHAIGAGLPDVAAVPLSALGVVRVYLVTARCTGGPPPGMFDETGDCYATWERRYVDLSPKTVPGLSKCLPGATEF